MLAAIVSSGSLLLDASKTLPRPISLSGRNFNDSLIKIQQSPITRLHLKKDEKMMVIFQASASLLFYSYASISVSFMLPFIRLYGNRQSYNKLNAARRLFNPITCLINSRWRHQMKTLSALLATCAILRSTAACSIDVFWKYDEYGKLVNWKHTAPHIVFWISERICLMLLTHSTK